MPAPRTDGESGARPEVMGQDLRLLRITEIYPLVMLEDTEGMRDAAVAWQNLGASLDAEARALRSSLAGLATTWQSDAATLFAERGEAAAVSMDRWADVAARRATELYDLAVVVASKKLRMQWIWEDFSRAADAIAHRVPPVETAGFALVAGVANLVFKMDKTSDLDDNMEEYTLRTLDEVVNPLANRFSEAAASFAERGPLFRGPTDAAVPSDSAYAALMTGEWPPSMPSMPSMPGGPGAPAVPAQPVVPTVPDVPAAPSAPALALVAVPPVPAAPPVPSGGMRRSVSAPTMPEVPAGATLSSLVAAAWVGAPGLAGRRAPATPSTPPAPGAPGVRPPVVRAPGVPATVAGPVPPSAAPPALPGRTGLSATPGLSPSASAPGAPHLPGGPGLPPGAAPPPAPRLPGRSGSSAPSSTPPPPPSLPGPTRTRTGTPAMPGTRGAGGPGGPNRAAAPTGPHLLGRDAATGTPPAAPPPPPSLGAPRGPDEREQHPPRPTSTTRSAPQRADGFDPSVPVALRSARTTGTVRLPDPAPSRAAAADPHLTTRAASTPIPPRADVAPPSGGRAADRAAGGRHRAAGARPATTTQPEPAARTTQPAAAELPELRTRPAVPAGPEPATPSAEQERSTPARPGSVQELGGRSASEPAAPSRAEERAAERARRRAEWVEARRRHQATLSR